MTKPRKPKKPSAAEWLARLENIVSDVSRTAAIARQVAHDFGALDRALIMSSRGGDSQAREEARTHWRSTGTWPDWLLRELGLGHLGIASESNEPRKDK